MTRPTGRPRGRPVTGVRRRLVVYLTPAEYDRVVAVAAEKTSSLSAWSREVVLAAALVSLG